MLSPVLRPFIASMARGIKHPMKQATLIKASVFFPRDQKMTAVTNMATISSENTALVNFMHQFSALWSSA